MILYPKGNSEDFQFETAGLTKIIQDEDINLHYKDKLRKIEDFLMDNLKVNEHFTTDIESESFVINIVEIVDDTLLRGFIKSENLNCTSIDFLLRENNCTIIFNEDLVKHSSSSNNSSDYDIISLQKYDNCPVMISLDSKRGL